MLEPELQWVCCDGGPHLLLPAQFVGGWEGTSPPSGARIVDARFRYTMDPASPATDYDLACDVEGELGLIPVGGGEGLVIDDDVPMSTWVPAPDGLGGDLVVWVSGPERGDEWVIRVCREAPLHLLQDTGLTLSVGDGGLFLFPACDSAPEWVYGFIRISLPPGRYRVLTVEYEQDSEGCLRLHRLQTWMD
jgi:immunity protein 21 of polymorphic toxin system